MVIQILRHVSVTSVPFLYISPPGYKVFVPCLGNLHSSTFLLRVSVPSFSCAAVDNDFHGTRTSMFAMSVYKAIRISYDGSRKPHAYLPASLCRDFSLIPYL